MRSEAEMMDLILGFARQHEDVRAVVMNGSRLNPNARRDPFQDYDIVYLVRDVAPYRRSPQVPAFFGEMLILQLPDDMGASKAEESAGYAYLMQFMDGNRIDLTFFPLEQAACRLEDSLSAVLLDKDGALPTLPPPSERSYLPQKPSAKAFDDCCNEFWWLNPYAAKGLWRGELTYTHDMLDCYLREQLLKMLEWHVGVKTGFQASPGKLGKYLNRFLDAQEWSLLEQTYSNACTEHTWDALLAMGELFRRAAGSVAQAFGFTYPQGEDARVSTFVRHIRALPPDARDIGPIFPE